MQSQRTSSSLRPLIQKSSHRELSQRTGIKRQANSPNTSEASGIDPLRRLTPVGRMKDCMNLIVGNTSCLMCTPRTRTKLQYGSW